MLTIEVSQLNAARSLLERMVAERRTRDNPEVSRAVDLLYGEQPVDEDLGVITRVAQWCERNPPPVGSSLGRVERVDFTIVDFLRALARYLPDRIVISRRGEAVWFAFELPQAMVSTGAIPRIPPPHQWYVHTVRVNAILKTYGTAPTTQQVRDDAHTWLRSEAYRIKLAATAPA